MHGERIAEPPTELGHVLEVHAVDACHHRRNRHERRIGGQPLGDLVLLQRDERQVDRDRGRDHVAKVVDHLLGSHQMIVDVAKIVVQPRADGWHATAVELAGHLDQRDDGVIEDHQLSLESVQRFDLLREC